MINEKQKTTIAYLQTLLESWKHTNDISSPTHLCEIQSCPWGVEENFSNLEIADLEDMAINMYLLIRKIS